MKRVELHFLLKQRKLFVYIPQRLPPYLQYAATLPCEIRKSKNVTKFSRWTWQLCL